MNGNSLISDALFASGVLGTGQTANADMTTRALRSLNAMLGQWTARRWLVFHLVNLTKTSTGATSYTVGPAGDFNIAARPGQIEAAFVSQNIGTAQQIDTPIRQLHSREAYNQIAMKQLVSYPYYFYYDAAMPLGTLYAWPNPNTGQYSLTLTVKDILASITDPSVTLNLPPEYEEALVYNLATRIRINYQMEVDAGLLGIARSALGTIRETNAQIATLKMPPRLMGARYNIYSDQSR